MKIDLEVIKRAKGIGPVAIENILKEQEKQEGLDAFESIYAPSDKYKIDKDVNLWNGDCLKLMSHIPDKSVDMILCDLPYGTTACSWDEVIPFEPLWKHYKRIIKDNGAIVLFGSEPFSTKLRMSNLDWYKYDWVWDKARGVGHLNAKKRPLISVENIMVFYNYLAAYHPQMRDRKKPRKSENKATQQVYGETKGTFEGNTLIKRYPVNLIRFSKSNMTVNNLHPTQKPVELLEYLIKTYTDEGMLVLDNTMGSGSTGVACKNTNRKFIGIELDEEYFKIAKERIYGDEE